MASFNLTSLMVKVINYKVLREEEEVIHVITLIINKNNIYLAKWVL